MRRAREMYQALNSGEIGDDSTQRLAYLKAVIDRLEKESKEVTEKMKEILTKKSFILPNSVMAVIKDQINHLYQVLASLPQLAASADKVDNEEVDFKPGDIKLDATRVIQIISQAELNRKEAKAYAVELLLNFVSQLKNSQLKLAAAKNHHQAQTFELVFSLQTTAAEENLSLSLPLVKKFNSTQLEVKTNSAAPKEVFSQILQEIEALPPLDRLTINWLLLYATTEFIEGRIGESGRAD